MIATHKHALSKRLYSYLGTQGDMAQYSDGTGAVMCCPVNGGMMIPCGEHDMNPRAPIALQSVFWHASFKKFNAMMFWKDKQ